MTNAKRDDNFVPTLTAALNSDGATITPIMANAATHRIKVIDGNSGSDNGPADALHDENHVPTLIAVSRVDGVTPVVIYSDSSGRLLVQST